MDDLDHCSGMDYKITLLKDDNKKAMKIASNMYNNAIKKREMSSVDLYNTRHIRILVKLEFEEFGLFE